MSLPLNIDYTDKVVVVSGAAGLICSAIARSFALSKAKVALLDLNEENVKKNICNKEVVKVIVVPNRIVNIVVK